VRSKLGVFLVYRKENNCSSIQLLKAHITWAR
jgi:hypothetical protein